MKKCIPAFIILAVVLCFFRSFFLHGLLPLPSDTIVGMFYPFRDLYTQTNPNGLPFHNSLITDPVQQQYPWRSLVIDVEKHFQLPLWNPYSFAGYPLLANFQSAVFYPLNVLFFLLPFSTAWTVLLIFEPLLGGLFLYVYLRNLTLHPLACLLGAIAFSFSGFSVAWMEWNTVVHTGLWVSLILLSVDKLLMAFQENAKLKMQHICWSAILLFALSSSLFAGHLQTCFYLLLIATVYFFARWIQFGSDRKVFFLFLLLASCFLLLTAVQWLPTLQFINLSARNADQNWHQAGWFIPWQNLLQFIIPDFFGNPATGNYWGVWNYGEFIGYIGIVPLIFSLFALFFRHDRKTLFFGTIFFLSLVFAFPTIVAQLPFMLSIPFLSTSQPTRLLFVTDFSLAILTALGLDYFIKTNKNTILYPIGFLLLVFIGVWGVVFFNTKLHLLSPENLAIAKHNSVLPTIIFCISLILFTFAIFGRIRQMAGAPTKFYIIICLLLGLTVFDLLHFAGKFETFASSHYVYPSTKATSYLQKHLGFSRVMATDDRILPPNFSVMYRLQTVDGYDPLYILRYGELIAASERKKPDISPPFGFSRIVRPKNYESPIMDILGVKYVLSLSDIQSSHLTKVFQDGETRIYENQRAFPRAIFVQHVASVPNKQETIQKMFERDFPFATTALVEIPGRPQGIAPTKQDATKPEITQYSENMVTIKTNTSEDTFLVLFDQFYPTWHATIDGKETKIYLTDYTFRGVFVPKGEHEIEFYDRLF